MASRLVVIDEVFQSHSSPSHVNVYLHLFPLFRSFSAILSFLSNISGISSHFQLESLFHDDLTRELATLSPSHVVHLLTFKLHAENVVKSRKKKFQSHTHILTYSLNFRQ